MLPLTWTATNNRHDSVASCSFLYDMMFLSALGFQVEEFMESVAGPRFEPHFDQLKYMVDDFLSEISAQHAPSTSQEQYSNGHGMATGHECNECLVHSTPPDEVHKPFKRKFIYYRGRIQHATRPGKTDRALVQTPRNGFFPLGTHDMCRAYRVSVRICICRPSNLIVQIVIPTRLPTGRVSYRRAEIPGGRYVSPFVDHVQNVQ